MIYPIFNDFYHSDSSNLLADQSRLIADRFVTYLIYKENIY
jgi:hypothetical protein